jgi:hypothetical protein
MHRSRRWFLRASAVWSSAALACRGPIGHGLFMNGIVAEHDEVNERTLPLVRMPNRNGFVADPRPDVPKKR